MTETTELRRQIDSAADLQSVVRTMKAMAASSVGQYQKSVGALADYYRTVELGLGACFRAGGPVSTGERRGRSDSDGVGAVVFGSDQGLVGRFNEVVAEDAVQAIRAVPGEVQIWAVGERVHARLVDAGLPPKGLFSVPTSVAAIAPLIGQILVESETRRGGPPVAELHLFYNHPSSGAAYAPVRQRLLPLDEEWRRKLVELPWPTRSLPEVVGGSIPTLHALIREFLFVSLFRACAESLASENASRLAAMERADENIGDLLATLHGTFDRLRQDGIDEELFDIVSGFEALSNES